MKHAVIKSGNRQYLVTDGSTIKVEKLAEDEGKNIVFTDVLLLEDGGKVTVGAPLVAGAKVEGKVIKQARHPKVMGVIMKAKKRSRKLFGHKQAFTEIQITKIGK